MLKLKAIVIKRSGRKKDFILGTILKKDFYTSLFNNYKVKV